MVAGQIKIKATNLVYRDNGDVERPLTGDSVAGTFSGNLKVKGIYLYYMDYSGTQHRLLGTLTGNAASAGRLKIKGGCIRYGDYNTDEREISILICEYIEPTGLVEKVHSDYATAHDAANASGKYENIGGRGVTNNWNASLGLFQIFRPLITIDTIGLSAFTEIVGAKFKFYVNPTDNQETDAGQATVHLVEGVFGATIDLSDYGDQLPKVTSGGSIAYADITPGAINEITLNPTGRGWINAGGLTKLCLRNAGDIDGSTPTGINYVRIQEWLVDGIKYPCLEIEI